jgi:hypothetical protein
MTLEFIDLARIPGYAGPLHAARHSALADRFHFWRGISGRRYACTRFPANRSPAYADAVSLFVRRRGDKTVVLGVSALPGSPVIPLGTEEIHLHIVRGGSAALQDAFDDLSALVAPRLPHLAVERRAA